MTFALGSALYFDTELFLDPSPFAALAAALFDDDDADIVQWFIRVDNKYTPPPKQYDPPKLIAKMRSGDISTGAVETAPKTPDPDRALVLAGCAPRATLRANKVCEAWMYDAEVTFGAARLAALGAARVVDAIVAFADRVAVRAGAIHWAETARFASSLATYSGELSKAQLDYIGDAFYWRPRWGEVARGPAWGVFLNAAHVEKLGGVARIERESGCARVVRLSAGGAFLQATAIDDPIVDERDTERLAPLAAFLAPVLRAVPR